MQTINDFNISAVAVKDRKKTIRSVLKLDKSFHVYVHGNEDKIERGFDEERGLNYYKLYFDKEQ